MATQLKQPATSPVVTTTFESIIDGTLPATQDGIKTFPDTAGDANPTSFGRNFTEVQVSVKLTNDGSNSPRTRYKAIYNRWKANAKEICELVLDFGGGETITCQGIISDITPTFNAGSATTFWIVTFSMTCSSVVFS